MWPLGQTAFRSRRSLIQATRMIVRMCKSCIDQKGPRVQRVKPLRTRKPRERLLSVAQPQFDPGASKPSDGRGWD